MCMSVHKGGSICLGEKTKVYDVFVTSVDCRPYSILIVILTERFYWM